MPHFVKDVEEIRQRALNKIEDGAVTQAYRGNKEHAIGILNEALATEIVCVLRYMHHYFMATGVHGKSVSAEFKEHADAEREHADQIAERIQQLGGKPDFNPRSLMERSASQYVEGETLADMIREDLVAERMVIEVYTDMIRHFGDNDPTTRVMLEGILKDEEEHASDLTDLLYIVDPHTGESEGQDPGTNPLEIGGNGRNQQQQGRGNEQAARGRDQNRQQQRGDQGGRSQRQSGSRGEQQLGGGNRAQRQRLNPRGGRQSTQQSGRREQGSQIGDGSPGVEDSRQNPGSSRGQQHGRRGDSPSVSKRDAGTTFAGSDRPNPPQPIRNRERNPQRGQRPGNGGNQPLQPSYFEREGEPEQQQQSPGQPGRQRQEQFGGRGSAGVEKPGSRPERGGRRRGAA
jgi:bacterioferritin